MSLACGGERTGQAPPDTTLPPPVVREPTPPISIRHDREFELTGDSVPEVVRATASGSSYDSLNVRIEIRTRDGTPLYADRWTSLLYFVYEERAQFSDAEVIRKVRGHIQGLVNDSSYYDPRGGRPRPPIFQVDREHLGYSIAERDWRDRHAAPDTAKIPPEAHSEIDAREAAAERLERLLEELARQPAFTYFAGGEANYTIAWSPSERRFFVVWACC